MLPIAKERARKPTSAFTLVVLKPGDALLNGRIACRHFIFPEDIDRETGGVTVTDVGCLFLVVAALPRKKACGRPAAVWELQVENLLHPSGAVGGPNEIVDIGASPKQHAFVMGIFRRR